MEVDRIRNDLRGRKMKKKIIILSLIILTMLTGCQETYANGVPTYFLEPEGYVIADVDLKGSGFLYGYILEEDYQSYLNGELDKVIVVKHPYEEGTETSTSSENILSIEVGTYMDFRAYK